MSSKDLTQRFIQALRSVEQEGDLEPMVALFSNDAQTTNLASPRTFKGKDGAREFWTEYRGFFEKLTSSFQNVFSSSERAALEWVTHGVAATGKPVEYEGVSILEFDGDQIGRFCAYFDPSALNQVARGDVAPEDRPERTNDAEGVGSPS